jgi:hypothetical protein
MSFDQQKQKRCGTALSIAGEQESRLSNYQVRAASVVQFPSQSIHSSIAQRVQFGSGFHTAS